MNINDINIKIKEIIKLKPNLSDGKNIISKQLKTIGIKVQEEDTEADTLFIYLQAWIDNQKLPIFKEDKNFIYFGIYKFTNFIKFHYFNIISKSNDWVKNSDNSISIPFQYSLKSKYDENVEIYLYLALYGIALLNFLDAYKKELLLKKKTFLKKHYHNNLNFSYGFDKSFIFNLGILTIKGLI